MVVPSARAWGFSYDPAIIKQMEKIRLYDVIDIKGVFVSREIKKLTKCTKCGASNMIQGNLYYTYPMFLKKRNPSPCTENQAKAMLLENQAVSNTVSIAGDLCNDCKRQALFYIVR